MKPLKPLFDYNMQVEIKSNLQLTSGISSTKAGIYLGKPVPVRLENSGANDFFKATGAVFHGAQRPLGHVGSWVVQGVCAASFVVFGSAFAVVGAAVGLARHTGKYSGALRPGQRAKIGAVAGLTAALAPTVVVATPVAIAVAVPAVVVGSAAALVAMPIIAGHAALTSAGSSSRRTQGPTLG